MWLIDRVAGQMFREEDDKGPPLQWAPMLGHALVLLGALVLGLVLARIHGTTALVGFGLIITTTSLAIGGALGFLFGVPRVATSAEAAAIATATAATAATAPADDAGRGAPSGDGAGAGAGRLLSTNTNLEKVSDWLTTMLVGVGLTQLGNINGALVGFRDFLRDYAVVDTAAPAALRAGVLPAVGPMLALSGALVGFVYFYVFTRVVITPKFRDIEGILQKGVVSERTAVRAVKAVAQDLPLDTVATRNVLAARTPRVEDSLSVMYEALYQPEGWRNVLKLAAALRGTEAVIRPDYWFYLAAAHGQEYDAAADAKAKDEARKGMLDAARRAVELNASYRARLWQISDPNGFDNDLAAFRDDADFLKLVGRADA